MGRRSRALERPAARAMGSASKAETSAGAPTGRTCGACGVLLSSSTTAKGTLARPLRGQSSGQRGRQGHAGGVMARAGRTSSGHRSHAVGPAQGLGGRGRTLEGGRAGGSGVGTPGRSAREEARMLPSAARSQSAGIANPPRESRSTPRDPRHRAGILPRRRQAQRPQPRLASSAAPASIAPSEARCATESPSSTRSSTRRNSIAKRSRPASSR